MYYSIGLSKLGFGLIKQTAKPFEPVPMPDDFYIVMEESTSTTIIAIIAEGGDIIVTENEV